MAIKQILYTDFLPTGFDKTNQNFGYLNNFGRELPKSIASSLSWGLAPSLLLDLLGRSHYVLNRAGSATSFDYQGVFTTTPADQIRQVPGEFGSRSALKLEGATTNIHPQAVVIDTNTDGIANTWSRIGNPLDCVLSIVPSEIDGDDQKVLSVDTLNPVGIETSVSAQVNTRYVVTLIAKAIRGTPTDMNAIVRGYDAGTTHIYTTKTALVLRETLPNGYGVYTTEVVTPNVTDFGNLVGFTLSTIATVSVGVELASTTEITFQIWHVQIQEEVGSSPIRTNGLAITTTADNLEFLWPTEVQQAGSLVFWAELPKSTQTASYTITGESTKLHLRVAANNTLILSRLNDLGTTSASFTPTIDLFDGNKHQFVISWDNYLDQYNIKHTPLMIAIDGVDQLNPLSPGVEVDPKTGRRCVNDEANVWDPQTSVTLADGNTFVEVENPYILARAITLTELDFVFNTTNPVTRGLNFPLELIKERTTLRWNFKPSAADSSADLAVNDFTVTGGPTSVFVLSWNPTDVVVSIDGTIVDSNYSWAIAGNQITFTPAIPDGAKVKIFGVNPTSSFNLSLPVTEVNGPQLVPFNCTILSARMIIVNNSGTTGETTEVDIKTNGSTIFSTRPSIAGDAGNNLISSNQILSVLSLSQNDILTLDLTDFSNGVTSVGVELLLESI